MEVIIYIVIGLAILYAGFHIGFFVSGMAHVSQYEDELIEKEMKNKMERKKNGKSN